MKELKNLLFISTHDINKGIISEYNKLSLSSDEKCILAIDNTTMGIPFESRVCNKAFYGHDVDCFIFDENLHKELNLPDITYNNIKSDFKEIMWYNADYRFYYIKKFFPQYKYYWQFDYDVFCNGKSYTPFLNDFANSEEDLLITNFRTEKLNGEWIWTHDIEWIYNNCAVFGSFFPICRLSNKAIEFLYKKRIEQGNIFKKTNIKNKKWLNCEIFVPTELMNNKFSCKNIVQKNVHLNEFNLNVDRIFEKPDGLLYHPVKAHPNNDKHICINLLNFKIKFKPNNIISICK